jgi:rubrerythrin
MGKNNNPEKITELINYLSFFENNVSSMYKEIAEKVDLPLIGALLREISLDSQKHSEILTGIAESLPKNSHESKEYAKTTRETGSIIDEFRAQIAEAEYIDEEEIIQLSGQLSAVENTLADEYKQLIIAENSELIATELERIYILDHVVFRGIFEEIIRDEGQHKKTLATIKSLLDWSAVEKADNTPQVRFQNPDAWSKPPPANI